jgi:hypothetical protein
MKLNTHGNFLSSQGLSQRALRLYAMSSGSFSRDPDGTVKFISDDISGFKSFFLASQHRQRIKTIAPINAALFKCDKG